MAVADVRPGRAATRSADRLWRKTVARFGHPLAREIARTGAYEPRVAAIIRQRGHSSTIPRTFDTIVRVSDAPPPNSDQPVTEQFAHQPIGARVPEKIAQGVYSTGQVVLDSPKEFVIDFLQGVTRPFRIAARVVVAPATMAELIGALKDNLEKYSDVFGPPPVAPPRPQNDRRMSIQEIYENFKIGDDQLCGAYANSILIGHSQADFFFDFITGFYPTAAVSSRIFLAAPVVPRFLGTLESAQKQFTARLNPPTQPPADM